MRAGRPKTLFSVPRSQGTAYLVTLMVWGTSPTEDKGSDRYICTLQFSFAFTIGVALSQLATGSRDTMTTIFPQRTGETGVSLCPPRQPKNSSLLKASFVGSMVFRCVCVRAHECVQIREPDAYPEIFAALIFPPELFFQRTRSGTGQKEVSSHAPQAQLCGSKCIFTL